MGSYAVLAKARPRYLRVNAIALKIIPEEDSLVSLRREGMNNTSFKLMLSLGGTQSDLARTIVQEALVPVRIVT
jgi:hypothetical protein